MDKLTCIGGPLDGRTHRAYLADGRTVGSFGCVSACIEKKHPRGVYQRKKVGSVEVFVWHQTEKVARGA